MVASRAGMQSGMVKALAIGWLAILQLVGLTGCLVGYSRTEKLGMLVHAGNSSQAPSSSAIRPTNPLPATGIIPAPGTAGTLQSLAPTMALNVTGVAAVSLYVEGVVGPLRLAPSIFCSMPSQRGKESGPAEGLCAVLLPLHQLPSG